MPTDDPTEIFNRKPRGFAALKLKDPERMKAIARKGGLSMPADKRSFSKNQDLARNAGRKGGLRRKPEPDQ